MTSNASPKPVANATGGPFDNPLPSTNLMDLTDVALTADGEYTTQATSLSSFEPLGKSFTAMEIDGGQQGASAEGGAGPQPDGEAGSLQPLSIADLMHFRSLRGITTAMDVGVGEQRVSEERGGLQLQPGGEEGSLRQLDMANDVHLPQDPGLEAAIADQILLPQGPGLGDQLLSIENLNTLVKTEQEENLSIPSTSQLPYPYGMDFNNVPEMMQNQMYPPMLPDGVSFTDPPLRPTQQNPNTEVQGYAKIEFADGVYFLNSYNLEIGRDVQAMKAQNRAVKRGKASIAGSHQAPKSIVSHQGGFIRADISQDGQENEYEGKRKRKREDRDGSKLVKRIKKSKSSGSSSQRPSRRPSMAAPTQQNLDPLAEVPAAVNLAVHEPSPHKMVRLYIHPAPPASTKDWMGISREHLKIYFNFEKSLWEALVKGRNGAFLEDAPIAKGQTCVLWNGCHLQIGNVEMVFLLPEHVPYGETGAERLEDLDEEPEASEDLRYMFKGKEMSLEFRDSRRKELGLDDDTSDYDSPDMGDFDLLDSEFGDEEEVEDQNNLEDVDDGYEMDDVSEAGHYQGLADGYDDEDDEGGVRLNQEEVEDGWDDGEDEEDGPGAKVILKQPLPPKRKVGRPPKDGKMSKRERKLAQKEAQKEAQKAQKASPKSAQKSSKKAASKRIKPEEERQVDEAIPEATPEAKVEAPAQESPKTAQKTTQKTTKKTTKKAVAPDGTPIVKNPVGRPRIHPRPDEPEVPREKRKYTKRKPKEPKDGESKPEGSGDEPGKAAKEAKPPRSPRSPTPTWDESTLTPEQLAKPTANYIQLIYEAIVSSERKQMSLPQIYRAIQRKYPYFVCRVSTVGWQSSVRHNLNQQSGFMKVEKDGKGWKWAIKPGATFEKEKKRKASPPPQYNPGYMPIHPGAPYAPYMQGYPPNGMAPPPHGYNVNPQMQNYRSGQPGPPQQYMGAPPQHLNGQYPANVYPGANGQIPVGIAASIAAQAPASYSSPYSAKPAATNSPPKNEQGPPPDAGSAPKNDTPAVPPQQPQHQYPPGQYPPQPYPPNPQAQTSQSHQAQPPQPQQPQAAPSQPQPAPQQPSTNVTPAPISDRLASAVSSFKKILATQMVGKENILDSAVRKVLGQVPDDPPGHPDEVPIIGALRNMLRQMGIQPGSNAASQPTDQRSPPPPPTAQPQPLSHQQASHNGTQASVSQPPPVSTGADKSSPSVTRPSYTSHAPARPNGNPMTRPQMGMPSRADSMSAIAPPRVEALSASPAPVASYAHGASTSAAPASESGQIAGPTRPLDESDAAKKGPEQTGPLDDTAPIKKRPDQTRPIDETVATEEGPESKILGTAEASSLQTQASDIIGQGQDSG